MSALLKDLEELFAHSEQRVLAAFVAVKCDPASAGGRSRRALPKPTGKPRVICLTAKRRTAKRGFKGTLHVCKLSQGRYQVRKSVRLKLLTRIEAFIDSPGQQEYFELTFLQRGFTSGELRLAFEVKSAAVRLELLGTLYTFCRAHEKQAPQVVGIDISELESSAAQYNKQVGDQAVGQTARALLKEAVRGGAPSSAVDDDVGDVTNPLWGQREDKQIQSLLEMVSGGAATMEELQQRLQTELAALEDASVHEILENGGQVARVLGELGGAIGLLDDLEQNLGIFDAKLRHMREDIAAIEDRNNQLELHSRNNAKLLGELEALVGRLTLPEGAERALQPRDITASNQSEAVAAAWELHFRLQSLQEQQEGVPDGAATSAGTSADNGGVMTRLPRSMASMAAVSTQRQHLHSLQRSFVDKATAYLQQELARVADTALQRLSASPLAGLAGASAGMQHRAVTTAGGADHSSLRRRSAQLAQLLEVVGALRPAAVVAPREAYCHAVNSLLRQEVHAAAAEVRRMAAAADAGNTHEPDLLTRPTAAEAASTLERLTSPLRSARSQREGNDLSEAYRRAGVIPIHEGFQALLDSQLPALAEEASQCIALMFPKALPSNQHTAGAAAEAAGGAGSRGVRFAEGGGGAGSTGQAPLDAGSKEVQSTLASLLIGVDAELLGLIDSVRASRAALCLPMLGATLAWKARLAQRGAACRPLLALLGRCEERLGAVLAAFFRERTGAIQRHDGRGSAVPVGGGSAKGQHVLPFTLAFPAVAARMEELLERWPAQPTGQPDAQQQQRQQQQQPPLAAAPPRQQQRQQQQQVPGRPPPSPFESTGRAGGRRGQQHSAASEASSSMALETEEQEISFMGSEADSYGRNTSEEAERAPAVARGVAAAALPASAQQQQQQGAEQGPPGNVLRELVDGAYQSWLGAMCGAIEALGAADAKHASRLRLENYAFLHLALQSLPLARSPALAGFASQAGGLVDRSLSAYVEQQVENVKLTRLLEFSRRLDEAIASVGSEEVHLQQQFQPGEVRQLLAAAGGGLDKRLLQEHQRILKHLAATSPHLVDPVWSKLEATCLERWGSLESQLASCYRGIELRPTAEELRRMFRAAQQAAKAG